MSMKIYFSLLFFLALVVNLSTQSALKDPLIPQGETIRYRLTQKGKQEFSYQIVNSQDHKGQACYLVENQSVKEISKSRILKEPFLTLFLEQHNYAGRAESVVINELLSLPELETNEIGLLDMADMSFLLRGYPFDEPREMVLALLNQQPGDMGGMSFKVLFRGEEKIVIDGSNYKAYKLEMKAELEGAMALFSGMIPKTYFWYDQRGSHPLLKFTGSGGPGTNAMLMEMVSYQSENLP